MNHKISSKSFGRQMDHRLAMFKNLAVSLIEHETINTTVTKAKELRKFIEPLVTLAGKLDKDPLHVRRLLIKKLSGNKNAIEKLIKKIGPFYSKRQGGYTRVLKNNFRPGDNAPMALIQFVDLDGLSQYGVEKKETAKPAKKISSKDVSVKVPAEKTKSKEVTAKAPAKKTY